jgi:hypothetical protein
MYVVMRFWDKEQADFVELHSVSIDPCTKRYTVEFLIKLEGDDGFDAGEQHRRWTILNHPGWIELETGKRVRVQASGTYFEGTHHPRLGRADADMALAATIPNQMAAFPLPPLALISGSVPFGRTRCA